MSVKVSYSLQIAIHILQKWASWASVIHVFGELDKLADKASLAAVRLMSPSGLYQDTQIASLLIYFFFII